MKAWSQTAKHAAIRMLLWQDIAVLRDSAGSWLQIPWSFFAIVMNISVIHIDSLVFSKRQLETELGICRLC